VCGALGLFLSTDTRGEIAINTIFFTIVERGKADKIIEQARKVGSQNQTVLLGRGTSRSRFFTTRALKQRPKEIVMIEADQSLDERLHQELGSALSLHKRHKGIAFTIPFDSVDHPEEPLGQTEWQCILTIVDKGKAEACVKAARKAGAKGGTVIDGRGAGVPAHYYVDLQIEPQKEIVIVLVPTERSEAIQEQIIDDLELNTTGAGMLLALPVSRATGLVEELRRVP
jgi:nitrogen regulatory protein PII